MNVERLYIGSVNPTASQEMDGGSCAKRSCTVLHTILHRLKRQTIRYQTLQTLLLPSSQEARDCFKPGVVDDMASILPQSILAKREAVATVVMTLLADFKKYRLEGEPSLVYHY